MKTSSISFKKLQSVLLNPLILHLFFVIILYAFLYNIGEIKQLPNSNNLVNWDAGIYKSIKNAGYFFNIETSKGNTGFYPLFPYLWKLFSLTPIGIAIFNLLIFLISFQLLIKAYKIPVDTTLLYLSIPSIIFFFLPYAESLFFLFSTLLLIGWKKKDYRLLIVACSLASITRPSILYFIPCRHL